MATLAAGEGSLEMPMSEVSVRAAAERETTCKTTDSMNRQGIAYL